MVRVYEIKMAPAKTEKEFFYVGIAHDPETSKRIVKFGTTNDLPRRRGEHRRHEYKQFPLHDFEYVSFVKLSRLTQSEWKIVSVIISPHFFLLMKHSSETTVIF